MAPGGARELQVWSFNLRTEFCDKADGPDGWSQRRSGVAELLRRRRPALVCCQEATQAMLEYLAEQLRDDGYAWVGVSRSVDRPDETAGMLFDASRLRLVDHSAEWFGPPGTPAGAAGWDAALPRTMETALFRVATWAAPGAYLRAVSTHFDHVGTEARAQSASQLLSACRRWSAERPEAALVVCGDFNSTKAGSPAYARLAAVPTAGLRDVARAVPSRASRPRLRSTIHKFQGTAFDGGRGDGTVRLATAQDAEDAGHIDWLFWRNGAGLRLQPRDYEVVTERLPSGRYPSDHFPIQAVFDMELRPAAGRPTPAPAGLSKL
eukprot:CAMPEP_0176260852 /NCGR_PEP_ID=MMETSP0121_2-20121125/39794_1 /TAXON_ID=160619 /ORGANISM="Kryptoperidinium foliaceum, Strain CCMP 1326" /LENGTH=321 /DNA_ID=CAMNT_0017600771 /DNA_START=59 /DNA_END=1024 /DNA_ORIENTATION=-